MTSPHKSGVHPYGGAIRRAVTRVKLILGCGPDGFGRRPAIRESGYERIAAFTRSWFRSTTITFGRRPERFFVSGGSPRRRSQIRGLHVIRGSQPGAGAPVAEFRLLSEQRSVELRRYGSGKFTGPGISIQSF